MIPASWAVCMVIKHCLGGVLSIPACFKAQELSIPFPSVVSKRGFAVRLWCPGLEELSGQQVPCPQSASSVAKDVRGVAGSCSLWVHTQGVRALFVYFCMPFGWFCSVFCFNSSPLTSTRAEFSLLSWAMGHLSPWLSSSQRSCPV